jgi:thymidylate kinase
MSSFAKKPFLISIEGNIGAGKTTIIDSLSHYLKKACPQLSGKILFLKEPVDIWGKHSRRKRPYYFRKLLS